MISPTARSLALLREEGWLPWIVEQTIRIPGRTFKRDLFNCGDIIALKDGETLLVQTTSGSNFKHRVDKVTECEYLPAMRKAGWTIQVWGWRKLKGRWACRREDIS